MATIGSLNIFMNADYSGVSKAFSAVQASATRFQSVMGGLGSAMSAFAGTAMVGVITATVRAVDNIGDLAERTNTTTEALTRLQYTAQLTGGSIDSIAPALQRMNRTLGDAMAGSAEASKSFTALGLNAAGLSAMSSDKAFAAIADAISRIPTVSEKAAAATKIFGRGAQELLGVLSKSRSELTALSMQADALGYTLSSTTSKAAGEAADALDRMSSALSGLKNSIVGEGGGAIAKIANTITGITLMVGEIKNTTVGSLWGKAFDLAWGPFADIGKDIGAATQNLKGWNEQMRIRVGTEALLGPRMVNPVGAAQAKELTDWVAARDAALASAAAATTAAKKSAEEFTKALEMEVATLGMSADEAELYRLRLAGVAEADLIYAQGLMKKKKAEEEARKATEDRNAAMEEGKRLTESLMTSEERYASEVAKLDKLLAEGAIDRQTYERGVGKAFTESVSGLDMGGNDPLRLASSNISRFDTGGGAAALDSAMARNTASNDQKQVKLLEEHNKKLAELIALQKNSGGVVVLGPIQKGT